MPVFDRQHVRQHERKIWTRARLRWHRFFRWREINIEAIAGDLRQKTQAVIEFMIANTSRVVFELIHHFVHREHLVAGERIHLRLIVGERGALNGVAVVKQQRVGKLFARIGNQGCDTFEADSFVLTKPEIVVAQHIGVQIGRLQQRHVSARAVGDRAALRRYSGAAATGYNHEDCDEKKCLFEAWIHAELPIQKV